MSEISESDIPTQGEAPVATDIPTQGEAPNATDIPTQGEAPVATDIPTQGEAPVTTDIPTQGEAPVATDIPTQGEAPVATDIPDATDEVKEKPCTDTDDNIEVGYLINADGLNIVTRSWKLGENTHPRAIVFICHGLAEHAARYDPLAKFFTEAGVIVFSHDHVGHGRSEGERAQIANFGVFSRDVIQHITAIRNEYPSLPLFLFGHSMGSLIAVEVVLQKQEMFRGLLLSGLALKPDPHLIGPISIFFSKIIARIAPSVRIAKLPPPGISRDENEVRKYIEDPLVYSEGIKAGLGAELLKTADLVIPRLGEIHLPTLVFHGGNDTYTFVGNSHLLFNAIQSEDKQIKIWPGARHELHNEIEPDRTEAIQCYVKFVLERI